MDQTLRQWSDSQGIRYEKAWRMYQENQIPNAYQNTKGRIYIKEQSQPVVSQMVMPPPVTASAPRELPKIPDYQFKHFVTAADSTNRINKAGMTEIPNRFHNIDMGILPTVQTGDNRLSCRDLVTLCQKSYHNVSIVRQITDLIIDLSIGQLFLRGGSKKYREFFYAYFKKIGLDAMQEKYYLELWRSSNVFMFPWKKEIKKEDITKITQTYGGDISLAAKKVVLPTKYIFLNPADIQAQGCSSFANTQYYKVLNSYEIASLKNPKTDADRELLESLPKDAKDAIKRGTGYVSIPLDAEDLIVSFYKKTDYEPFATPVFFSVLDDINFKMELKKQDLATLRMMNQSILLFTMGAKPDEGGINYNNIEKLQSLLSNSSVARYLVCDYTTKGEFLTPDIGEILGKSKYEVVENDIYIGLNYILLNGDKFANKMAALKIFLAKIRYGQNLFIRDVVNPLIENVSKELGFKNYPEPYFEYVNVEEDSEFNRLVVRLAEIGHMTPSEVFDYFDSGKLPLWEESVEHQKEFATYRDDGLYQPITGNPASQLELLKETNKNALKIQENDQTHDDKQKTKDRKHAAENPQSPAPQIVLNAPTKLAQPKGRPTGKPGKKMPNRKTTPRGASVIYSGTKLIESIRSYSKLEKEIEKALLEKHKLEKLSEQQQAIASEIGNIIARNEEPEKWQESVGKYLENPLDKNLDRVKEIESIAASYGLDPHLASLLFNSQIDDLTEIEDENIE